MEDLKCEFIGYEVSGITYLHLWGGETACIKMDDMLVEKEEDIMLHSTRQADPLLLIS